jgi:hypothetical protein
MKIIFSRKGFDSGSGGRPSPILNNAPISLPIPSGRDEPYRYCDVYHPVAGNLGDIVAKMPRKISPKTKCHFDPQLPWHMGSSSIGQQGAAQSHLANQGISKGDVFVFFGLFQDPAKIIDQGRPHQRIFGMMTVRKILTIGPNPKSWAHYGLERPHPHTERPLQKENNTLYVGRGHQARNASDALRLTLEGENPSAWICPDWLKTSGLSYHKNADRWQKGRLDTVARGQEFVADVQDDEEAADWLKLMWHNLGK